MWDTAAFFAMLDSISQSFWDLFSNVLGVITILSIKSYLSNHVVKRVRKPVSGSSVKKNIFQKWRIMFMSMVVAMMTMMKMMTNMII